MKIQDYGIIGNGRSAALISKEGSIDWLCWPRFDSSSFFAKLVDSENGGFWQIAPTAAFKTSRKYIENTNVLISQFSTSEGVLSLTDFMPVFSEDEKKVSLQPEHEIIRHLKCEEGNVEVKVAFSPKPKFGSVPLNIKDKSKIGLRIELGRELITLKSEVPLSVNSEGAYLKINLKKGEHLSFSLTYNAEAPAVIPPLQIEKLTTTIDWWQTWSSQITYQGTYREQVIRSALLLKLLGFAPSGTFQAALTTSLPQKLGGDLNWDYRFCWLRDAAFTVKALFGLGIKEEGKSFVSWLLHSTRLTLPKLKVLYDVYGNKIKNDHILPQFKGYANSYPVREGNGVQNFFELDVYGEVIESVTHQVKAGLKLDRETKKMLLKIGQFVLENWRKPDTGIWEKMTPLKHYTHSKLMCWVAFDRLIQLHEKGELPKSKVMDKIYEQHAFIRSEIETSGWNEKIKSYTQTLEGNELDSSLLVMPLYGFDEASSLKMQSTLEKIKERLSPKSALFYRYEKSTAEGEGVFVLCSFWYVEFLAKSGLLDEAKKAFEEILKYVNDLQLFSEELDPYTGDALGNFPQGFSHIGLINAAIAIEDIKT